MLVVIHGKSGVLTSFNSDIFWKFSEGVFTNAEVLEFRAPIDDTIQMITIDGIITAHKTSKVKMGDCVFIPAGGLRVGAFE